MILTLAQAAVRPSTARRFIERCLATADVRLDGDRPWDLRVHDQRVFWRVLVGGSLAFGESYVDGWWDCPRLDEFFARLLGSGIDERHWLPRDWLLELRARLFNRQRPGRVREVARRHYDLDPQLYRAMLGEQQVYSCAYWRNADTLAAAQSAKLDLVCRKLGLKPGMRVLDIGCGWGTAARHAAVNYGVEVVGITISHEQAVAAREHCRGLPVEIIEQDYRALSGRFERIFSIGMFEHVGQHNYRTYLETARRCLADDGLFLLHTIGADRSSAALDAWLDRYIFPNANLPSARWLTAASEGLFVIEDWHNFGPDYDRTLMEWHRRLEEAWPTLSSAYDERARRLWRYYLLSCAGSFRARKNQLWQLVFSPRGVPGGYAPVR
jgi:cyclopropane-fatty-acyl-phospholipid synthase